MMPRLVVIMLSGVALLAAAMPAPALGEDPLEHAVLLGGTIGWIMVGLALLLMALFMLWTRRDPR